MGWSRRGFTAATEGCTTSGPGHLPSLPFYLPRHVTDATPSFPLPAPVVRALLLAHALSLPATLLMSRGKAPTPYVRGVLLSPYFSGVLYVTADRS